MAADARVVALGPRSTQTTRGAKSTWPGEDGEGTAAQEAFETKSALLCAVRLKFDQVGTIPTYCVLCYLYCRFLTKLDIIRSE